MIHLVKVRTFYDNNIKYYCINSEEPLQKGSVYVGSTRFGHDLMEIHCPSRVPVSQEEWHHLLEGLGVSEDKKNSRTAYEPVIQFKAKESDITDFFNYKKEAEQLSSLFKEKAAEHGLDMKVIKLHFTYRREKLVCSYTADQRVDFREFVKDIGAHLRVRIEMFQISPKDAITFIDACGTCGRRLCCLVGCNLVRFQPERREGHNPKTTGLCGKTKCCNAFEIPANAELNTPETGGYVCGENSMYSVRALNTAAHTIVLNGPEGEIVCTLDEIYKVQDGSCIHFEYRPFDTAR